MLDFGWFGKFVRFSKQSRKGVFMLEISTYRFTIFYFCFVLIGKYFTKEIYVYTVYIKTQLIKINDCNLNFGFLFKTYYFSDRRYLHCLICFVITIKQVYLVKIPYLLTLEWNDRQVKLKWTEAANQKLARWTFLFKITCASCCWSSLLFLVVFSIVLVRHWCYE